MQPSDPYALLEVGPDVTPEELKRAYRRLAKRWHPDRNPTDPTAPDKFKALAAAYELLSEPSRRRAFDVRRGSGVLDEEFLDRVADAVERGQRWAEQVVVPHFAVLYRGAGAEMAVSFVRASSSARPGLFEARSSWWGRRRARRWLRDVSVSFDGGLHAPTGLVFGRNGQARILVSPGALWREGLREASQLDELVLVLLVARYAQVIAQGRFVSPRSDTEEAWAEALQRARALDTVTARRRAMWMATWAFVFGLLTFMLVSGVMQW